MTQRIFIALPISNTFKKEIEGWKEKFKHQNPDIHSKVRWMPPENLHITLIPPFYKDENEIKNILKVISSREGKIGGFELNFEKISYGPTNLHPRLIWITGKPNKRVKDLKRELERFLKLPYDNRPFYPHITIGRFREKDFRSFSLKKLDVPFSYIEKFKEFLLMESRTLPEGAVYKVLGIFKVQ